MHSNNSPFGFAVSPLSRERGLRGELVVHLSIFHPVVCSFDEFAENKFGVPFVFPPLLWMDGGPDAFVKRYGQAIVFNVVGADISPGFDKDPPDMIGRAYKADV